MEPRPYREPLGNLVGAEFHIRPGRQYERQQPCHLTPDEFLLENTVKKFNDFFAHVPVIESERLLLRPFRHEDMPEYMAFFTAPDVQRYLGGILIPKDARAEWQWVENINGRCLKAHLVFTWCVECKETAEVIGRIDLGGFVRKSMAELSYYFSCQYWHKGFATEAVRAVAGFGFNQLGLHRIQATVMPENTSSIRVLEKNGFEKEGLLRQYSFGTEFHDVVMMSKLREAVQGEI